MILQQILKSKGVYIQEIILSQIMFYKFLSGQTFIKNAEGRKASLTLCYPPSHLHHILYELFKNSMRATLETHGGTTCYSELPEIEVMVAKGPCDVSIRISDKVTLKLIL